MFYLIIYLVGIILSLSIQPTRLSNMSSIFLKPFICENGGTELTVNGRKQCACLNQYYIGTRCEHRKDYCKSDVCLNQGTCVSHLGGYTCSCTSGFYGKNCSLRHKQAPFASNPRLHFLNPETSNPIFNTFIVMEKLPENTTMHITLKCSNGNELKIQLPRDNSLFVKVGDEHEYMRRRVIRSQILNVNIGAYILPIHLPAVKTGVHSVSLTTSYEDPRSEDLNHSYNYFRRTSSYAGNVELIHFGCSGDIERPTMLFQGFGQVLSVQISSTSVEKYRRAPDVEIEFAISRYFWCLPTSTEQLGFNNSRCFYRTGYKDRHNITSFIIENKTKSFEPSHNYFIIEPYNEDMAFNRTANAVSEIEFEITVRRKSEEREPFRVSRGRYCYAVLNDELFSPWPPYATYQSSDMKPNYLSTRNVYEPSFPYYKQPRNLHSDEVKQDFGSAEIQKSARLFCVNALREDIHAYDPFKRNEYRAYSCKSERPRCFCRLVTSWQIASTFKNSEEDKSLLVDKWIDRYAEVSTHELVITYYKDFIIPKLELRVVTNYHRFAAPELPIDVLIGCVDAEVKNNLTCARYLDRVWWESYPPIPIVTDRMEVLVSTLREAPAMAQSYHYRARARFTARNFYDLKIKITTSPKFFPSDCKVYFQTKDTTGMMRIPTDDPGYHITTINCEKVIWDMSTLINFEKGNSFQSAQPHYHKIYVYVTRLNVRHLMHWEVSTNIGLSENVTCNEMLFVDLYHQSRTRPFVKFKYEIRSVTGGIDGQVYMLSLEKAINRLTYEEMHAAAVWATSTYCKCAISLLASLAYLIATESRIFLTKDERFKDWFEMVESLPISSPLAGEQIVGLLGLNVNQFQNNERVSARFLLSTAKEYHRVADRLRNMTYLTWERIDLYEVITCADYSFLMMQKQIFRNCPRHLCGVPSPSEQTSSNTGDTLNYDDITFSIEDELMKFEANDFWIDTANLYFSCFAYLLKSNQQPYMWTDKRKLLLASFHNISPWSRRAFIRTIYVYSNGFTARVSVMSHRMNIAVGCLVSQRNIYEGRDSHQKIDTVTAMMRFYSDPSPILERGFENITNRHRLLIMSNQSILISLKVLESRHTYGWIASSIELGSILYYRAILDVATDCIVVFHPNQGEVLVGFSQIRHPDDDEIHIKISSKGHRMIIPRYSNAGPMMYIGFKTLKDRSFFNFSIYGVECFRWTGFWNHTCQIAEDLWRPEIYTPKFVSCRCKHLHDTWAAQCYSPPIVSELPVTDQILGERWTWEDMFELEAEDHRIVVIVIGTVSAMIILLFLGLWCSNPIIPKRIATPLTNLSKMRTSVKDNHLKAIYLHDNNPTYTYTYLVCVETEWKYKAGTTANVCLQLIGNTGQSMPHLLRDRYHRVLFPGSCVYFIVMTERCLCNLQFIKLWHDHTGLSPSWACRRVHVCDMQVGKLWVFNVDRWLRGGVGETLMIQVPSSAGVLVLQPGYLVLEHFHHVIMQDHPYINVITRHPKSSYTGFQRAVTLSAVLCIQMLACSAFVGVPYPSPHALIRESSSTHIDVIIVLASCSALLAAMTNFVLSYFFINYIPRDKGKDLDPNLPKWQCDIPFTNQYFRNRNDEGERGKCGGLVTCVTLRGCGSPRIVGPKRADCVVGEPKETPFCYQYFSLYGWSISLIFVVLGLGCTYVFGLFYNEDRSYEFLCCYLASILMHIALMEPLKAIFIAIVTAFIMKEMKDPKGKKNILVLPRLYLWRKVNYQKAETISMEARRLNPAYRIPKRQLLQDREDMERNLRHNNSGLLCILVSIILCILSWKTVLLFYSPVPYFGFRVARDLFVTAKYGGIPTFITFRYNEIYRYINSTVVYAVHPLEEPVDMTPFTADGSHKMIGVGRLRQNRHMNVICPVQQSSAQDAFNWTCIKFYSPMGEFDELEFGPGWSRGQRDSEAITELDILGRCPFKFVSAEATESLPVFGIIHTHEGGGYVGMLGRNRHNTRKILYYLNITNWINNKTSALFYELTLYNTDANIFQYVVIIMERLPTGSFIISHKIWTGRLFLDPEDILEAQILVCLCIVASFCSICYLIAIDASRSYAQVVADKWHLVDIVTILIVLATSVSLGLYIVFVDVLKEDLDRYTSRRFVSAHGAMVMRDVLACCSAFVSFLCIIRVCKLFQFDNIFSAVGQTFLRSLYGISGLVLNMLILSIGFITALKIILARHLPYEDIILFFKEPCKQGFNGEFIANALSVTFIFFAVFLIFKLCMIIVAAQYRRVVKVPHGLQAILRRRHTKNKIKKYVRGKFTKPRLHIITEKD